MREILFRGKRKDTREWVYGWYCENFSNGENRSYIMFPHLHPATYALICVEVIPETVGQYTGLTDKNGKKIFEGDIVKVADDDGNIDCCDCGVGEVIFCVGMWYVAGDVNNSLYDINNVFYIEVIGNIHEQGVQ